LGAFVGNNSAEITDSAAIKTIETAKTTKAEMIKSNIKSGDVTLLVPPSGSKTTLALEIKLQQYVVIPSCGQTRKIEESFREVQQIV
jgi:hypothetical protein